MLLFSIIAACLLATVIAIVTAYSLNGRILDRWGAGLSCVSTGLLLTLAFTHLLPEAFEHAAEPRHIGIALWAACVLLFTLEQIFDLHHHSHGCEEPMAGSLRIRGVWPIVIGDSLHTFTDGIVIASSFLVSPHLGWAITAGCSLRAPLLQPAAFSATWFLTGSAGCSPMRSRCPRQASSTSPCAN